MIEDLFDRVLEGSGEGRLSHTDLLCIL